MSIAALESANVPSFALHHRLFFRRRIAWKGPLDLRMTLSELETGEVYCVVYCRDVAELLVSSDQLVNDGRSSRSGHEGGPLSDSYQLRYLGFSPLAVPFVILITLLSLVDTSNTYTNGRLSRICGRDKT